MTESREINADLAARALDVMPGGVSHDSRQLDPLGPFIRSALGARKNSVDGRSYIDLACGNGSLILGHGHKPSMHAASDAIVKGFHFSAGSEAELTWAERVRALMPAAQQVRFTSSGNEACLLALAVSRAVSGNAAMLTIAGHYHGWAAPAVLPVLPLELYRKTTGLDALTLIEAQSVAQATDALASGRFGAIILEPTGASFGKIPLGRSEVEALTTAARTAGALCIFDETITGFRVAPGGAQQLFGIAPDLIVLGKILGGGLPCGALAGRRDLLRVLDSRSASRNSCARVSHMGTGNGNPVVASLGAQTLLAITDGRAIASADAAAARLRAGINRVFAEVNVPWAAYGQSSGFHIFMNPDAHDIDPMSFDATTLSPAALGARNSQLVNDLRIALLAENVDINPWPGGLLSAAHDDGTIDQAILSFARAAQNLSRQQPLSGWGSSP